MAPKVIMPFLWSYDQKRIDLHRDRERIILNLLNLGSREATDWLFSFYPKSLIKRVLKERGSKGELSPKSLNYWTLMLKIDKAKLSRSRF